MKSLAYIGAGLDIIPIIVLSEINKFIFVDSQPQSPYGTFDYDTKRFYNSSFCDDLIKIMANNSFSVTNHTDKCIEFKNADIILKYYISVSFPEHLYKELVGDIGECDTLMLAGFCPHKVILDIMPKLETIVGNCHTCYTNSYDDDTDQQISVFEYLIKNPDKYNYLLLKEKQEYEYYEIYKQVPSLKETYEIVKCKDLVEIEKYKIVYQHKETLLSHIQWFLLENYKKLLFVLVNLLLLLCYI